MSFYFFPDDADKLDTIAHLLPDRNGVGAPVALLPEPEGRDAAGVLEPPLSGRLLLAGRGHRFTHGQLLVKVMGLHRRVGHGELLDVLGAEMDHRVDVLVRTFNEQELRVGDERPVRLVEVRVHDGVGDAGLVFKRQKDEAVSGAGPYNFGAGSKRAGKTASLVRTACCTTPGILHERMACRSTKCEHSHGKKAGWPLILRYG